MYIFLQNSKFTPEIVLLFLKMTKDPTKIHIPINAYKGRKLCPDYTQYLYVINQETHKFYNKL
jgi:hypothetical protein